MLKIKNFFLVFEKNRRKLLNQIRLIILKNKLSLKI